MFISSTIGRSVYLTCKPKSAGVLSGTQKMSEWDGLVYRCIFPPLHFVTASDSETFCFMCLTDLLSRFDGDGRTETHPKRRRQQQQKHMRNYSSTDQFRPLNILNIREFHAQIKTKDKTKHFFFICENYNAAVFHAIIPLYF